MKVLQYIQAIILITINIILIEISFLDSKNVKFWNLFFIIIVIKESKVFYN